MRTILRIIGFIFCAVGSAWAEDTWHRCELPAAERFIVITYMSQQYTFGVCFGGGADQSQQEIGLITLGVRSSSGPPLEHEPLRISITSVTSTSATVQVLEWIHHEKLGRLAARKVVTVPFDKSESLQLTNPQNVTVRYVHAG